MPGRFLMLPCAVLAALIAGAAIVAGTSPAAAESEAQRWVDRTLRSMTVEELAGQLLMPGIEARYTSTDSDRFERWRELVGGLHVGGVIVFGGTEPSPGILLNDSYSTSVLGDPLSTAATLNRLQAAARVPLLAAGDFEYGVGMRIAGATVFPRAMALGAAGDPGLVERTAAVTADEMRAIGLHVDFAPVADVNSNPKNPVINTRSFGEDPRRVGEMTAAAVRGLQAHGVLATVKHFPGHGDTEVDTHLGLATVTRDRAGLDAVELPSFRAAIGAGVWGVMAGHLRVPAIDPEGRAATLSAPVIDGLLRRTLGFDGVVVTDSLSMSALADLAPGEMAVRAVEAGSDLLLDPADPEAARDGLVEAIASGRLTKARIEASVRRVLDAKARLGLHRSRAVALDRVADIVGTAAHQAVAEDAGARAITLVRDEQHAVPIAPGSSSVLALTLVDYGANWFGRVPGSELIQALKARWPATTAVQLTDRTGRDQLDLVRAMATRFDVVVIASFVRTASGSGRTDLSPGLIALQREIVRARPGRPTVSCIFGNPYAAAYVTDMPAVLVTFDLGRLAEASAARALAGEAGIHGRLPIALPGMAQIGAGLDRGTLVNGATGASHPVVSQR